MSIYDIKIMQDYLILLEKYNYDLTVIDEENEIYDDETNLMIAFNHLIFSDKSIKLIKEINYFNCIYARKWFFTDFGQEWFFSKYGFDFLCQNYKEWINLMSSSESIKWFSDKNNFKLMYKHFSLVDVYNLNAIAWLSTMEGNKWLNSNIGSKEFTYFGFPHIKLFRYLLSLDNCKLWLKSKYCAKLLENKSAFVDLLDVL